MPGDLPGHLGRPYPPDGQVEVSLRPRGQAVAGRGGTRSGSITFREVILRRSRLSAAGSRVVIGPVYFTEGLFPEENLSLDTGSHGSVIRQPGSIPYR